MPATAARTNAILKLKAGGRTRLIVFDTQDLSLGRASENDISVDDPEMSRRHAVIDDHDRILGIGVAIARQRDRVLASRAGSPDVDHLGITARARAAIDGASLHTHLVLERDR